MTDDWLVYLVWVIPGSALGGVVRHSLSGWMAKRYGERFPVGTLSVNVIGAFLIGVVAFLPWEEMMVASFVPFARVFFMYGFLGGFTTVSSFSLQTFSLLQEGKMGRASLNIILSLGLCLAAVAAGSAVGGCFI